MSTSGDLATTISAALHDENVTTVVVDLRWVTFIDMFALSDLIRARGRAHHVDKQFWVIRPYGAVRWALLTTGTLYLLTAHPDGPGPWVSDAC